MGWLARIIKVLPELPKTIGQASVFVLAIESLKLIPPFLLKIAIDYLLEPEPVLSQILWIITGVLVASLAVTAIEVRYMFFGAMKIFHNETGMLRRAHDKLLSLGLKYHESHPTGDVVHLMNKGSQRLADMLWFFLDQFLGAFFQILVTSLLLIYVHPLCGLVFILFLPVVIFLVHRTSQQVQPYRQRYHNMLRDATWEMNQSLLNVRTVKDYAQEAFERRKYDKLLDEYLRLAEVRMRVEHRDTVIRDIVLGIARFAVLFYAAYLVFAGAMTAGSLYLFATLSEKVIASLYRLGRLYSHLGDSMESVNQFSELFEEVPDIIDSKEARTCEDPEGTICYEDVNFSYQSELHVLKDITLEIPAKASVAFVGPSGAGKSTMIKLLSRHYDVTSGRITLDGEDIRSFKVANYRSQIAIVPQHIEIFDCSVKDNIAYGLNASEEEVSEAARLAHADEFIDKLPEKYETRLGERGLKLSGGQRQRIGIARALLRNPAILVFDEATSSLDTESEQEIQKALQAITRRQTMIIIAHRLSTIKHVDMIVVFDDGKIVEIGDHESLTEKEGLFARMQTLQARGMLRE